MTPPVPSSRFGDDEVDRLVGELLARVGAGTDEDLVRQLVVTALRMHTDETDRLELKIASQALAEMHHVWKVFSPYRHRSKVMVFGSARTRPGDPDYELTRTLGRLAAEADWMVLTGAGPGAMVAAMEGAGQAASMGVNIALPFEQRSNDVIDGDPKLATVRYFFTRKLAFVKESDAFVLVPGGFGTLDEAFELITLMQTGKTYPAPVVLLDHPAGPYWERWRTFVADELLATGLIGAADMDLFHHTRDPADAVRFCCDFYSVYHSLRYVGPQLVLRLNRAVDEAVVDTLAAEFGDIIVDGAIDVIGATRQERRDDDVVDLPRLALRFDHRGFGRLHQLIRRLNALGAPGEAPPVPGGLVHDVEPEADQDPMAG
jgi:uncharacterized protein (TIGR00730 family)